MLSSLTRNHHLEYAPILNVGQNMAAAVQAPPALQYVHTNKSRAPQDGKKRKRLNMIAFLLLAASLSTRPPVRRRRISKMALAIPTCASKTD